VNGNVTAKKEYDYGSGAPGSLLRQTVSIWMHVNPVNSQDYTSSSIHILDRKTSDVAEDGSGNPVAQTQYEYDNYTTPIQSSGATQHDASYSTSYTKRGNATSSKRWLNPGNTWLTTGNTYDDAGNVLTSTDPGGRQTQMDYTDNFSDGINHNAKAYVTRITLPTINGTSHIEKKQYFYDTR